ncbi:auxin-responsive protein IAA26-like [Malania oleifera]|uniref:auxin-responsive protein IAA26-like n=1 Tax=Malania oleifera TaxID=397392 RepID=UPI0025AE04AD|nr:auxin-responsive protein IAA26-like [Malania oleifera]XP_057977434.1 auxin-responsive protein IAA26-like [Malania oleifera]
MEGCSRNGEARPQLLDLIPKDIEWLVNRGEERSHGCSEEKKLELRLGPPGEDWNAKEHNRNKSREKEESIFSLGYFSNMHSVNHAGTVLSSPWSSSGYQVKAQQPSQQTKAPFLQFPPTAQRLPAMTKDSSQPCCPKVVEMQTAEKKAFSPASAPANTAVPNSSQKRTAPAPVVGWPPIRSFRKNLASSSSSKQALEPQNVVHDKVASDKPVESCRKGLFVKINMDGVPIGRKVDLKAYDSYDQLCSAVDELFRGLLAAQRDSSVGGTQNKQEEEKAITGLLDGIGEYTLVYEDNEGDRMLVGDVPWNMFVSTAKRLRVLKSSEISTLGLGSNKQGKMCVVSAMK